MQQTEQDNTMRQTVAAAPAGNAVTDAAGVAPAAAAEKGWAAPAEKDLPDRKSIGEKKFDQRAYVGWAGIGTFILSVALAYIVKDSRIKVPFYKDKDGQSISFKEGYDTLTERGRDWILNKGIIKKDSMKYDIEKKEMVVDKTARQRAHGLAASAMLTTATFLGGFVPLPIVRYMEKNKAKIVRRLNEKYGNAEEVAIGERNVAEEAPQSWGSIAKGRIAAWLIVFVSFAGIGARLVPNTFGGLTQDAANAAGFVGSKVHGNWPKGSMEFFKAADDKELEVLGKLGVEKDSKIHHQMYDYKRNGQVAGVDFFATTMATSILYMASKAFAGKKAKSTKSTESAVPAAAKPVASTVRANHDKDIAVDTPGESRSEKTHSNTVASRGDRHAGAVLKETEGVTAHGGVGV